MTSGAAVPSGAAVTARVRPSRSNARGIAATWWYTASAILGFELILVLTGTATLVQGGFGPAEQAAVLGVGVVWVGSTAALLNVYRQRSGESAARPSAPVLALVAVAAGFGVLGFAISGLWLMLLVPVGQSLLLLDWAPTVRTRLTVLSTLLVVGVWIIDEHAAFARAPLDAATDHFVFGFFCAILLPSSVLSLWWWDVLTALDRARISEARLAATQERLSVATDVHDLQGHHLQVIALQLELAERLLARDPDGALEQLRAARVSVDEARQGTRDLATRFRSVSLSDELANARDLLRAAGLQVRAEVAPDADAAPGAVFGPVIRETTTNVLRHGGGRHAALALTRADGFWRYEIRNDVAPPPGDAGPGDAGLDGSGPDGSGPHGSGLDGIARRAGEAGGTVQVVRGRTEFTVVVTAPVEQRDRP
ncbi:sensor histidine kinase [Microbacteriaceae bacterium VKM Ac-2854]|nr:sensor histidine kinase [Microbacteriaceae bacterium VKM Ac-2854]